MKLWNLNLKENSVIIDCTLGYGGHSSFILKEIKKGFLVGTIDENKNLHFSYQHINLHDEIKTGFCDSVPEFLDNGKIRFYENWKWSNDVEGKSVIEEM